MRKRCRTECLSRGPLRGDLSIDKVDGVGLQDRERPHSKPIGSPEALYSLQHIADTAGRYIKKLHSDLAIISKDVIEKPAIGRSEIAGKRREHFCAKITLVSFYSYHTSHC